MFGFSSQATTPSWHTEMQEIQQRWQNFASKLEERMLELCESAMPELEQLARDDSDTFRQSHYRMLSGVRGQLTNMRDKLTEVWEEKINGFIEDHEDEPGSRPLLASFRDTCRQIEQSYEEKHWHWWTKLEETGKCDLEERYQRILTEYAAIKDQFTCQQCGSPISIEKIYFLSTYIACPHCQTQNTFAPSMQARQLESLGRSLAEQRTAPLLAEYEAEKQKERTLYQQIHENRPQLHGDVASQKQRATTVTELEQARTQAIARAPILYETWLRAMFDEWNRIVPDLHEQNERFYQRLLGDFRKHGH